MTVDGPRSPCCAPGRETIDAGSADTANDTHGDTAGDPARGDAVELIELEGGRFAMGTDRVTFPGDGEGPVRPVTVDPFAIAAHAVTNAEFAEFCTATDRRTDAERFGWSFVFAGLLPDDFTETRGVVGAEWWRQVHGADWQHPEGPQSTIDDRLDHPVVHVSWTDAAAYAAWAGARLPTEAEWEFAARGGHEGRLFPWGDEVTIDGAAQCNIFEGDFPTHNTAADGYVGTAPVDAFAANDFGLHNTAGNTWEWCGDWFDNRFTTAPQANPRGPETGSTRVMRGGSYLCHDSYCNRYRTAARHSAAPDSSTGHLGFRIARDLAR